MNLPDKSNNSDLSATDILKNRQIKITPPRRIILQAALQFSQPFRAEQLLEISRKEDRAISQATVYRFLTLLTDHNIIRHIDLQKDGCRYYEIYRDTNFAIGHIICHNCQQVLEVIDPCLSLREKLVANNMGFTPTKLDLRIEANCQELNQKGHCTRSHKKQKKR